MHYPTRLIRDSTDRYKLEVSLPGGRYQLSLDDRAAIVLTDRLGLSVRDTVPEPFVPFFVAMGDAWFPRQRDVDSVIRDLSTDKTLTTDERSVLISYVTESRIAKRNANRVRLALKNSPISGAVDPDDLRIQEPPQLPDSLKQDEQRTTRERAREDKKETEQSGTASESQQKSEIIEKLKQIPGIGPLRAEQLADGGIRSLESLANSRPGDVSTIDRISEEIAAVAVEGAREVLGQTEPASKRLQDQTGVPESVFDPALSSLAASGVPASEAMSNLRVLYGPTVADIDAVSGQQAYFLWEAGYQTPYDVLQASPEELAEVYQLGSKTATEIQESARTHLRAN